MPSVVVLQNRRFDRVASRFVAKLVLLEKVSAEPHYLAPRFTVEGQELVSDVFNLAAAPADRLGSPVASLADENSGMKLDRALDEFLSQA